MSQPLQLSFQTNTDQARNAVAQLASTVATNMLTIGSAMKAANDNQDKLSKGFSAIGAAARTAVLGFVAFEAVKLSLDAVTSAAEAARKKLQDIVDVANKASQLGVGTNFLQQWTHDAQRLSIEAEHAAEMLQHARDASTVKLGTGGNPNQSEIQDLLGEHVQAKNIAQGDLDSLNAADSTEQRIRVILDLIDKLRASGKELAALNIGEKMFGAEFANQLRNGVDLTNQMRASLTKIQDVTFPPDIIKKAQQLDEQLKDAQDTMEHGWAPIQQDILRWQQTMLQNTADLKTLFADIVGIMGRWYTAVRDISGEIDKIANSGWIQQFNKYMESKGLLSLPRYEVGGVPTGEQYGPFPPQGPDMADLLGANRTGGGRIDRSNPLPSRKTPAEDNSADEVDTYIKSLQKAVEVLNAENETFGKSNTLKAEAVDLEKALAAARTRGTPLTDAEREAVKKLADEEGAAKDKAEQLKRAQEAANEQAQLLGNSLISAFDKIGEKGARATDVIKDMVQALIKAVEQALILGTGPFANLFGTFGKSGAPGGLAGMAVGAFGGFGGGGYGAGDYAAAAAAAAPGMYGPAFASGGMVGRDGKPMFIPYSALASAKRFDTGGGVPAIVHPGEVILNAAQQRNVVGSMGGGARINVTHAPVINGTGLSAEQVFAVIQRSQKEFARQIGPLFSDWQRRHG